MLCVDNGNAGETTGDARHDTSHRKMGMDEIDPLPLQKSRYLVGAQQHLQVAIQVETVHRSVLCPNVARYLVRPTLDEAVMEVEAVAISNAQSFQEENLRPSPAESLDDVKNSYGTLLGQWWSDSASEELTPGTGEHGPAKGLPDPV